MIRLIRVPKVTGYTSITYPKSQSCQVRICISFKQGLVQRFLGSCKTPRCPFMHHIPCNWPTCSVAEDGRWNRERLLFAVWRCLYTQEKKINGDIKIREKKTCILSNYNLNLSSPFRVPECWKLILEIVSRNLKHISPGSWSK